MIRKALVLSALVLSSAGVCKAEMNRPLLTRENKFPELHQVELGSLFQHREFGSKDLNSIDPYVRYGLLENLTAYADVPVLQSEPDDGDDETGIGDIKLGLELLAYQDVFEYPYIIPHLDVSLDTGDEDDGFGTGETIWSFGVSVGTVVYEVLHYIGDLSYGFNNTDGSNGDDNHILSASVSIIWDISPRYSVLAEGRYLDQQSTADNPVLVQGGMVYKATDSLSIGAYGGGWHNTDLDSVASLKVGYTF